MMRRPSRAGFDMDAVVGLTLRAGVLASVALIAAGLAWHWAAYGDLRLAYTLPATSVGGFVATDVRQITAAAARPRLLVNLGIALLMLTPYARVCASVVSFAIARDWKYVACTGLVLAVLSYSLFA
jgi:uncharacterized membrane protein